MSPTSILLLGEGNFSFTKALVHNLMDMQQQQQELELMTSPRPSPIADVDIVTTSYDHFDELIQKYPESKTHLLKWKQSEAPTQTSSHHTIHVKFKDGIDASRPLRSQLQSVGEEECCFDHIIFNFPHLGLEDCNAHSVFLAHFFHSCDSIVDNRPSTMVYITLTRFQSERWKLLTMASRHHYNLVHSILLRVHNGEVDGAKETRGPFRGYEWKRHQHGKSFRARVVPGDEAVTFCFQKQPTTDNTDNSDHAFNLFQAIYDFYDTMQKATTTTTTTTKEEVETDEEQQRKRAKASPSAEVTKEKWFYLTEDDSGGDGNHWQCKECSKRFRTLQGVRTHVHTQHNTINIDIGTVATKTNNWRCEGCEREFSSETAMQQHFLSKHTASTVKAATTPQPLSSSDSVLTPSQKFECVICGSLFDTSEQLQHHQEFANRPIAAISSTKLPPSSSSSSSSIPPSSSQLFMIKCLHCSRELKDERALRQHTLYAHGKITS